MTVSRISRTAMTAMLTLWYALAVVGFDVHHDNHDHQLYVVSLLNGISCEDVHPDDDCACRHHHENDVPQEHHHDHASADPHDDCTDDIHKITITGTDFQLAFDFTPFCSEIRVFSSDRAEDTLQSVKAMDSESDLPPDNILSSFCILRV